MTAQPIRRPEPRNHDGVPQTAARYFEKAQGRFVPVSKREAEIGPKDAMEEGPE